MKILCEANDMNKLKDVVLSIDVTDNLVTVAVSKIHFSQTINSQKTISQIQVISVNTTEVKEVSHEHNSRDTSELGWADIRRQEDYRVEKEFSQK